MEIDTIYPIDNKLFLVTSKNEVEVSMDKTTQRTTIYHGTIYDTIDKKYSSGFYINNGLYKKDGIYTVSAANKDKLNSYIRQQEQYKNVIYHKDLILKKIHVYKFNHRFNYFYPISKASMDIYVGYRIIFEKNGKILFRKITLRMENKDDSNNRIGYIIDYLDTNVNVKENYEHFFQYYKGKNSSIFQELRRQCQNFNFLPSCIPIFLNKLNKNDTLQSLEIHKPFNIRNRFFFCPLMVNSFIHYYYGFFYIEDPLQRSYGFFFITKDGKYDFLLENQYIRHINMYGLEFEKMYVYKDGESPHYFYPITKISMDEYLGYSIESVQNEKSFPRLKLNLFKKSKKKEILFVKQNLDKSRSNEYKHFYTVYENANPNIFKELQTIRQHCLSHFASFFSSCTPIFSKIFNNHENLKSLTINRLYPINSKKTFFLSP